jgi:16S rRNA (cytosine1402-N4)-methyltransferase
MVRIAHRPVMVKEILDGLECKPNKNYVDATVGGGGHALEILKQNGPNGKLLGIDLDEEAIDASRLRLKPFGKRVTLVKGNYKEMEEILHRFAWEKIEGIVFDLGASYDQLTSSKRGFSFQHPSSLDMRYDRHAHLTAYEIVNSFSKEEITKILFAFGEESWARSIARKICQARQLQPINTTAGLAEIVRLAIPVRKRSRRIHPATKTFQALRIRTNDELNNLQQGLDMSVKLLALGGRLCVLSYHSLEDRIVKRAFRGWEKGSEDMDRAENCFRPRFRVHTKKPIRPTAQEVAANPRARSAKLRIGQRV